MKKGFSCLVLLFFIFFSCTMDKPAAIQSEPGNFLTVSLEKSENAIMVPNSSILPQGRSKFIFLYNGGKAKQTEITTGIRDSTNIQVLGGIKEGDTVITSGLLYLRPDADVTLTKVVK